MTSTEVYVHPVHGTTITIYPGQESKRTLAIRAGYKLKEPEPLVIMVESLEVDEDHDDD